MFKVKVPRSINALLIGIAIFLFFIFFDLITSAFISIRLKDKSFRFFEQIEKKSFDLLLNLESKASSYFLTSTVSSKRLPKKVSRNIVIVGIDEKSLAILGRWPFRRVIHSKFTDYFSNLEERESILFFDLFFTEPDLINPEDDFLMSSSFKKNGKVIVDYIARGEEQDEISLNQTDINIIKEKSTKRDELFKSLVSVKGDTADVATFNLSTLPILPVLESIKDTAFANAIEDFDKVVREYPLIAKFVDNKLLSLSNVVEGFKADKIFIKIPYIYIKNREIKVFETEVLLFDQTRLPIDKRAVLNSNDIADIRFRIEQHINNLKLDIEKIKLKRDRYNKKILLKINKHLHKSRLESDVKKEIYRAFNDSDNLKDIDLLLDALVDNIRSLLEHNKNNEIWENELYFFQKMQKEVLKVERGSLRIGMDIDVYDLLYKKNDLTFEKVSVYNEQFLPSIVLTLVANYFNVSIEQIDVNLGKNILLKNPKIYDSKKGVYVKPVLSGKELDSISIPIDKKGFMLINYAGPPSSSVRSDVTTFDTYSYSDFLDEKDILVRDKIVMVGAFSKGVADDMYQTPFKTMYGIEIIANSINTIITNGFVRKLSNWNYIIILFCISVFISLVSSYKNITKAYLIIFIFILSYIVIVFFFFFEFKIFLQLSTPLFLSGFTLIGAMGYRVVIEEKERRIIKSTFSKYVSPSVVERIINNPPELGGIDVNLTVFFSDIRDFTSISELLSPQELVKLLNSYLSIMTDVIFEYDGTLDKYIGDAIMCFWGAPDPQINHAELACKAALKQIERLKEFNQTLSEKFKINIGIGINSGIMTVGNMGSHGRMSYTLTGDNVNLASRLEGANKVYGTNIIVSEYTYTMVKDKFVFRELDSIRVKGKHRSVVIYELLAEKG